MDNNQTNDGLLDIGSDPTEDKSHPVGKAAGGIAGAALGAAAGSVAGPIGTIGGAAIGGIAGWLEGKTIAEGLNPDNEMSHWKENYSNTNYYIKDRDWNDYESAYQMGIYSYNPGTPYGDVEDDLAARWDQLKGTSRLTWDEAKNATRDSYEKASSVRGVRS